MDTATKKILIELRRVKEDVSRDMCSNEQCKKCSFCSAYNLSKIIEEIRQMEGKK